MSKQVSCMTIPTISSRVRQLTDKFESEIVRPRSGSVGSSADGSVVVGSPCSIMRSESRDTLIDLTTGGILIGNAHVAAKGKPGPRLIQIDYSGPIDFHGRSISGDVAAFKKKMNQVSDLDLIRSDAYEIIIEPYTVEEKPKGLDLQLLTGTKRKHSTKPNSKKQGSGIIEQEANVIPHPDGVMKHSNGERVQHKMHWTNVDQYGADTLPGQRAVPRSDFSQPGSGDYGGRELATGDYGEQHVVTRQGGIVLSRDAPSENSLGETLRATKIIGHTSGTLQDIFMADQPSSQRAFARYDTRTTNYAPSILRGNGLYGHNSMLRTTTGGNFLSLGYEGSRQSLPCTSLRSSSLSRCQVGTLNRMPFLSADGTHDQVLRYRGQDLPYHSSSVYIQPSHSTHTSISIPIRPESMRPECMRPGSLGTVTPMHAVPEAIPSHSPIHTLRRNDETWYSDLQPSFHDRVTAAGFTSNQKQATSPLRSPQFTMTIGEEQLDSTNIVGHDAAIDEVANERIPQIKARGSDDLGLYDIDGVSGSNNHNRHLLGSWHAGSHEARRPDVSSYDECSSLLTALDTSLTKAQVVSDVVNETIEALRDGHYTRYGNDHSVQYSQSPSSNPAPADDSA